MSRPRASANAGEVVDQPGRLEAVGDIPAGPAVAARVRHEHLERRGHPGQLPTERVRRGRRRAVRDDKRRSGAADLVADVEAVGADGRHGPPMLPLRLALDLGARGAFDAQVAPPVVEQRHRMVLLVGEGVDPADEQVVIARREGLDDRAFERGDGPVDERQAGRARVPGGPAELVAAGLDRRAPRSSRTAPAGPRTGCTRRSDRPRARSASGSGAGRGRP